jgi:hypothetical protein
MSENIQGKLPEKWLNKYWALHDENSRFACYAAVIGCHEQDSHPTIPTHWAYDFFLIPKMKLTVKWRPFDNIEKIQSESQDVMKMLKRIFF